MRAFLATAQYRGSFRLDSHDLNFGFVFFQHFTHAGNRAASTHTGHENINLAVCIAPNFFGSGFAVNFRISLVIKLARHKVSIWMFVHQRLGFSDSARHTFSSRCQNQLCTECTQQHFAFFTHAFRHSNRQFITAGRTYHCQTDTGIAAGRLNDNGIFIDFTGLLRRFNHGFGNTVFHAAARIEKFKFNGDLRFQTFSQTVQFHQRCITDQLGNIICNFHFLLQI